jgi:hypothetical protein
MPRLIENPPLEEAAVTGGCTAEAVIDGVAYGPDNDTPANAIVIPDRDDAMASWSGEVPYANTNFSGDAGDQGWACDPDHCRMGWDKS